MADRIHPTQQDAALQQVRKQPALNLVQLLTATANVLDETPTRILNHTRLTQAVMAAADAVAGKRVHPDFLFPVWELLPTRPDGDEYGEYASRLRLTASTL